MGTIFHRIAATVVFVKDMNICTLGLEVTKHAPEVNLWEINQPYCIDDREVGETRE
ncbi:hypothetical protein [Ktedonosporobacter rubrisoli]|uniref:hypothetical protein n=1 Tax=Ktedonosporobacter rubrisoli TaxID=2509675 RepID=UPI0013EE42B2|nr:hypothetical protein [Ktedonosporobacter rubrisoli]